MSSHAGIDTLFQAPFTTRRARDDCAESEEVRPRAASVIEGRRGGRTHATPALNGGIRSTGVGLGLRADGGGGVMMTAAAAADTVRSERDCFSWPTQNPPRHQLPGKFEAAAAALFALTRSQLIATTWRERASERARGLPQGPPPAQILQAQYREYRT